MKKLVIASAAICCIAGNANAQSNVTLYGIIDAAFLYSNNVGGGKLYSMSSGNIQGSRWGLRGSEDLGDGLKAIFDLENGFMVTNGRLAQGGDLFGRQAYVGLQTPGGTVTLGRQWDSVVDFTGLFEVGNQWGTFYGAHPGDLDNLNGTNRVNNAVKFTSAKYGGFTFGGVYSPGGVAGQFNRNQIWSLGAGYTGGSLSLGAAYLNVSDPNYSFFGNNAASSANASNFGASSVISGYASAKRQQVISAGGAYTFGSATVGAVYSNTQFKDVGAQPGLATFGNSGTARFNNVEVNFNYFLTPALMVGAAYDYTKGSSINKATYHQAELGVDYFLSKRTDIYAVGIYQHASGTNSLNQPAVANITGLSASSTANQVATLAGIRHKF